MRSFATALAEMALAHNTVTVTTAARPASFRTEIRGKVRQAREADGDFLRCIRRTAEGKLWKRNPEHLGTAHRRLPNGVGGDFCPFGVS